MSDRKVVLKMVMSLDGFVTSPDGTHEWMFEWFGDDSGEWNRRALEEAGVHAMGRRSYEIMGPHWAASEGPIATAMNEKPKAVFSRTLEKAEWGPAEIFGGDLGAEIADLKARDDEGTVLVHGGPDFAKSLTRLGLVDEYQLTTVPIAIGAGHSPFAELREHLKLDVVEEERFQSGALAQILVPKHERPPEAAASRAWLRAMQDTSDHAGAAGALDVIPRSMAPALHPSGSRNQPRLCFRVNRAVPAWAAPHRSPYGRMRMIVFPLRRSVGLRAATASSRVATMAMLVRSRPSRTR